MGVSDPRGRRGSGQGHQPCQVERGMVSTYWPGWRGHLKAPQLVWKEKARKSNDTVTRDHGRGR